MKRWKGVGGGCDSSVRMESLPIKDMEWCYKLVEMHLHVLSGVFDAMLFAAAVRSTVTCLV